MATSKVISFKKDDMVEQPAPHLNLEGIEEVTSYVPADGSPYRIVECKPAYRHRSGCPHCGSAHITVHGKAEEPRLIHDVNTGIIQVDLLLETPRYRCQDCGRTFHHRFDCIPENTQMTARMVEQVKRDAFIRPFKEIADSYGISATKVADLFDDYTQQIETTRPPIVAPRVLGLDEKHIVHDMRAVFVDIETGRLLEMTATNRRDDIVGTICSMIDYDKNIKVVTMDMANGYRTYVQFCLPHAKIVVDKYHIFQGLYQRIGKTRTILTGVIKQQIEDEKDPVRKREMENAKSLLDAYKYLFKFGQAKLAEDAGRLKAMYVVCETFKEFNHLRLIKVAFEAIYNANSKEEAMRLYDRWVELVPPRGTRKSEEWGRKFGLDPAYFIEFQSFRNTTRSWYEEIFNYFDDDCRFTNAATEGLNCLIERINRQGNGYSFARLRAKALFYHLSEPKKTFRFDRASRPVYGYVDDPFDIGRMGKAIIGHPKEIIIGYESYDVLVEEEGDTKPRKPLSVFSYVPEETTLQA